MNIIYIIDLIKKLYKQNNELKIMVISNLRKYNGTLQEFAIAKFCYTCEIDENGRIVKVEFRDYFAQIFIDFSNKIQSIENQKDSNGGKMNINDLKKAINEFNKELVDYINYEDDYNPDSPKQKPSFDKALSKMFQKDDQNNENQITIVDILKQAFAAAKNKEQQICSIQSLSFDRFDKEIPMQDFVDSFVTINKFLASVDLDKDLATGPFKTIMLYLIQPICQIFQDQEWAKNLIEEKKSIKLLTPQSVAQSKTFVKMIKDTVSSGKSIE